MNLAEPVPAIAVPAFYAKPNGRLKRERIEQGNTQLIVAGRQISWDENWIFEYCISGKPFADVRACAYHPRMARRTETKCQDEGPVDGSNAFVHPQVERPISWPAETSSCHSACRSAKR